MRFLLDKIALDSSPVTYNIFYCLLSSLPLFIIYIYIYLLSCVLSVSFILSLFYFL